MYAPVWRYLKYMASPARRPLPSTFTSLYRIFLRASSATVLHHFQARKHLRKLWRPHFDDAAAVAHRLQRDSLPSLERAQLQKWFVVWEERMDNTLSLLLNSARSRGLPHALTRNFAWLCGLHRQWSGDLYCHHRSPVWKPNLPPNAPEYHRPAVAKLNRKLQLAGERAALHLKAWGAFGEVVGMAEGRDGLSFGKMTYRQRMRG